MKSIKQNSFRGCSVGITGGSDLWSTPLRWGLRCHVMHTKFREYSKRRSNNIAVNNSIIWEAALSLLLIAGIHEVRRWDGLRWHDVLSKLHHDRFRHSSNIKVINSAIWEAVLLMLLMGEVCEISRRDDLRWHDILTKLHENWGRHSNSIEVIASTVWEVAVLDLLMGWIYEVRRSNGIRCHYILVHTTYDKVRFRRSKVFFWWGYTHTDTDTCTARWCHRRHKPSFIF
jgi:hypothetical protein